jgi:hypothetical protein
MLLIAGSFLVFLALWAAERAAGPAPKAAAARRPILRLVKSKAVAAPERKAA